MTEKVRKSGQDKQHEKACSVDTKQDKEQEKTDRKMETFTQNLILTEKITLW